MLARRPRTTGSASTASSDGDMSLPVVVEQLLAEVVADGFTVYCCGPKRAPHALVAAYEWADYVDLVTIGGFDRVITARVPIRGAVDIFAPEVVVWAYQGPPQHAMRALLKLVHPAHPDAPTAEYPAPAGLQVARSRQRPMSIRLPVPSQVSARAIRLAVALPNPVSDHEVRGGAPVGTPAPRIAGWPPIETAAPDAALPAAGRPPPAQVSTVPICAIDTGMYPREGTMVMSESVRRTFRQAWRTALGCAVNDGDDFFALGGDSMVAISVVAEVHQRLGVQVDAGWFYDHPRFGDALAALQTLVREAPQPVLPLSAGPRQGDHPISHQQEGLLKVIDRVGDAHSYQVAYAASVAHCDVGRLRTAAEALVFRHPALRTRIQRQGRQWRQHIVKQICEVETVGAHDPIAAAHEWARSPILLEGPLARFAVFKGGDEWLLVLAAHQLVIDPWSWGVVLRELETLYDTPDAELPRRWTYSDYARWQREWVDPVLPRHLEFWRHQASGYPADGVCLPGARRPDAAAGPAATLSLAVPAAVTKALRSTAQAQAATLFHVLLALFSTALARLAGVGEVIVGSATANRMMPETLDMIGFLVNGRFTRVRVDTARTPTELVAKVRESWRAGEAHDQAHLEKTVIDLGLPDMVNVKFSYNETAPLGPLSRLGGAPLHRVVLPPASTARRHLSVALAPHGQRLTGMVTYRTDVLDHATAGAIAAEFDHLMRRLAAGR